MQPTSQSITNSPFTPTAPLAEMYTVPITDMALDAAVAKHYYIDVSAGQTVSCATSGPNGDADLYMRFGEPAVPDFTSNLNICSSFTATSYDSCSTAAASEPTKVYAAVHAYATFSGLTFQCTVSTAGQPSTSKPTSIPSMMPSLKPTSSPTRPLAEIYSVPIASMALNTGFTKHYYIDVTAGQTVSCATSGPDGDADLYMRFGELAVPDFNSNLNICSSVTATSVESCSNVAVLATTRVYVAVHAYTSFSGLTFQCILGTPTPKPTRRPSTSKPSTRKPSTRRPSTRKPI
jgi:hypothetical protein